MMKFDPTHSIGVTYHDGTQERILVHLVEGAAYTESDWCSEVAADWGRTDAGEWLFQGSVPLWCRDYDVLELAPRSTRSQGVV